MLTDTEKLNLLDKKVDKILLYLYDDQDTGNTGIVQQVRDLRTDVNTIQTNEKVRLGKVAIISGLIGSTFGIFLKAIGGFILKVIS